MALFFYKEKNKDIRAAAYLRLSIEDGDKAESNSIGNQRELIRDFVAERPELHLVGEYADDGYTGTNFERPGFTQMMEDIKSGKINCIIVKDLSRLGRNYIEMGKYLEQIFPMMGIRFIAINDNYDNANTESSDSDSIVVTSLEFVENIFKIMSWNRECRYKILGRVANSDQGLCMLFDLEEAIMFTPKPQEYTDPVTGETKKKQIKFFPDVYKDRIGKSYNDYISGHQMNLFEDFIGYQGSAVLDEPEQKTDTISVPIPQCEESENIPLPDLSEQPENVQRPGSEVVEKGMLT